MKLVLLSLVGIALATQPLLQSIRPLQPRTETRFQYEGVISSGIPLPGQSSVSRIHSVVRVQTLDDKSHLLQLEKVRIATGNDEQTEASFEALEKLEISSEHEELLKMPVRFHSKNGMINEVIFSEQDKPWSKNIKRAIVNLLQVNTEQQEQDYDEQEYEKKTSESSYFSTETTIEGKCQVAYTVVPAEESKVQVTKSVNFDKCERSPVALYNARYYSECRDCEKKKTVQPQTVYTYTLDKISGLQKVEARSVYTYILNEQPVLKSEMSAKLIRESSEEISRPIKHPKGETEELIFSTEWENQLERFFKNGDEVETLPFEQYDNKIQSIKNALREMITGQENKPEHAHEFARLVRYVRMCSKPELEKVMSEVYSPAEEKQQTILLNALTVAGTKNTVEQVIYQIEKKTISKYRAVQLLKSIQETPYPSTKIADLLIRLAESTTAKKFESLRQSAWLAAGSVIRGAVSVQDESMQKHFHEESNKQNKEKYVKIFFKLYQESESSYEKVLALKTIANAAIDLSAYKLEKIILDKSEQQYIRLEAIDSLRLLKDIMPRKIQNILLPVYKNRLEKPEIRMAALNQILNTLPPKHILAQLATGIDRESSRHVAAFTYRQLESLSKSTNPCQERVASELKSVLRLVRYQPQEGILSGFKHLPVYGQETKTGLNFDFAALFGSDSVLPKEISASLDSVLAGKWNKYLAQVGFRQQNIDKVLARVAQNLRVSSEDDSNISRASRRSLSVKALEEISEKLNINSRMSEDKKSEAMVYLRYKDIDYAVIPIQEREIERLVEKFIKYGRFDMSELEALFNIKSNFEVNQALYNFEITEKLPTILGLPLTVTRKAPTVASVNGKIILEPTSSGALRAHLKAQPSVVSTLVSSMGVWTPLFEQGVKTVHTIQANTPVDFTVEVSPKDPVEIHFSVNMPEEKKKLMHVSSRPVAFLRIPQMNKIVVESQEQTIRSPVVEQAIKDSERTYTIAGVKTSVRGHMLKEYTIQNMIFSEQSFDVVIEPTRNAAKKLSAKITLESIKKNIMDEVPSQDVFDETLSVESNEYDSREESDRRSQYRKSSSGLRGAEGFKQRTIVKLTASGNEDRTADVEFTTKCNSQLRYCKVDVDVRRSPVENDRSEWTLKSSVSVYLPESVSSLQQLKQLVHREIQGTVSAKWGSSQKSEANIKFQIHQDKQQSQWFMHSEKKLQGIPSYELLSKAARLNQIKAVVDYKLSPESKHSFNRLYEVVKGYSFWHSKVQPEENQRERLIIQMTVEPTTTRFVNLTVQTPEERLTVEELPLSYRLRLPTLARRAIRESISESTSAQCEVKSSQVNTFDNVVIRSPLTTCYSVIAKDCSEERRFAVLLKKSGKNTQEKKMKIVTKKQMYEVELSGESLEVRVDGKVIRSSEFEQYNIVSLGENLIRVELEEVSVRFDGYTAQVQMDWRMQEKQCGLCGHFDGESENELRNAVNEESEDVESFHRSFLLKDEDCSVEEERLSNKKNYKMERESESEESEEQWHPKRYEQSEEEEQDMEKETEPKRKIRVEEQSHRVCFSMRKVKECKKSEQELREETEKVSFVCLPRHDSETRELLAAVRNNEEVSLEGRKHSYVRALQVPQACAVY